jgi:hypothetical protein
MASADDAFPAPRRSADGGGVHDQENELEESAYGHSTEDYQSLLWRLQGGDDREAQRRVLRETVADPRQRLAKVQVSGVRGTGLG